jgi:Mrp family chromosome partitioning ATPase
MHIPDQREIVSPIPDQSEDPLTQKLVVVKRPPLQTSDVSVDQGEMNLPSAKEDRTQVSKQLSEELSEASIAETYLSPSQVSVDNEKGITPGKLPPINKRDAANAHMLQEQCRQLCLSVFFREHAPVRSLGFTSSISGEGKSFLALIAAGVLAKDSSGPVILLEFNWEHACLHEYLGIPFTPGLAECLRGECSESEIHHRVDRNLTIVPAGNGRQDAVKLLQQIRQRGLVQMFAPSNELLIVDLPSVLTTAYGTLAASLLEALIIVVRAGATTDRMVAETSTELNNLPVQGVILNQVESRIPRWIRQLL